MTTCRVLAVADNFNNGYQPLAQTIYSAGGEGMVTDYNQWFTIPNGVDPGFPLYPPFFTKIIRSDLLIAFAGISDWVLELNYEANWYSLIQNSGGDYDPVVETYSSGTQISLPFGPKTVMPEINEKMLPHFLFPKVQGVEQKIGTLFFAPMNQNGFVTAQFNIDMRFVEPPDIDDLAELPGNGSFGGGALFNSNTLTGGLVIAEIYDWNDEYFMSPRASLVIRGYLQSPFGDEQIFQVNWGTPNPFVPLGFDPETGLLTETYGEFTCPHGQGQGVRSIVPANASFPEISVAVGTFTVRPRDTGDWFEYRNDDGTFPKYDKDTGLQLAFPMPLKIQ